MTRRDFIVGGLSAVAAGECLSSPVRSALGAERNNVKAHLPYDAEVEFIESTGDNSQYIDLSGVLGGKTLSATIKWCPLSSSQGRWIFGGGLYSTPAYTRYGVYASGGQTFITPSGESANLYYAGAGGSWTEVRDRQYVVLQTNKFSDSHIVLFCQWWTTPNNMIQARLFYSTFYDGSGNVIMDLIPVRFTNELGEQEGGLYDKVSMRIFRNQGSGAFVIGPEV